MITKSKVKELGLNIITDINDLNADSVVKCGDRVLCAGKYMTIHDSEKRTYTPTWCDICMYWDKSEEKCRRHPINRYNKSLVLCESFSQRNDVVL